MHIAVCDDNVADRKQLERLLGRESDKRKLASGVFYLDSFGTGSELFPKRQSYDLFFIDINLGSEDGLNYALNLCHEGVTAPIVLCSSKCDYLSQASALSECPSNLLFLNKPIVKAELSEVLDKAVVLESNREPTIELRHNDKTYYVLEDDIVYATFSKQYVYVFLKDGTKIPLLSSPENFYQTIRMYTHYAFISKKAVINIKYLANYSPFKVTLTDGPSFFTTRYGQKSLKEALEYYREESNDNQ